MLASLELPPGNFPDSLFASPDRHLFSHSRYLHFSLPYTGRALGSSVLCAFEESWLHTHRAEIVARGAFLFHKCCVPGRWAAWRAGHSEPTGELCNHFLLTSWQVTHLSGPCPAPQLLNCLKQHLKGTSSKLYAFALLFTFPLILGQVTVFVKLCPNLEGGLLLQQGKTWSVTPQGAQKNTTPKFF